MAFNAPLAKQFIKAGFLVFPLYRSTQRPFAEPKGWQRFPSSITSDGRDTPIQGETPATNIPASVDGWASNQYVIGYGVCAPHHIVFDLDVKNNKNGVEEFEKLRVRFNIPKPGMVVKSKSGGYHLYYSRPTELEGALVAKAVNLIVDKVQYAGVDLVANNGYVVGPEQHDGWESGKYAILHGSIESLPQCPLDVLKGQVRVKGAPQPTMGADLMDGIEGNDEMENLIGVIRTARIPDKIPTGNRDNLVTIFIGVLKSRKIPLETAKILCQQFLRNCELEEGETREKFEAAIDLDSKLTRFYGQAVDVSDPRIIARELVVNAGVYKCLEQLPGSIALVATKENPYLERFVIYNETKARQDLLPYAKPIPDSDSPKAVNPLDIVLRDQALPRVHSTGYYPRPSVTFVDPSDGTPRVNTYLPPTIGTPRNKTNIVELTELLAQDLCGDLWSFVLDFMAHMVQKPHIKMNIALLMISVNQGTGKNTLVQVMKPLIGPKNYLSVPGIGPLVEDKSVVLEGNVLVVFNEVARPSNRSQWTDMAKAINKIKTSITESSTQINPKYEKQRKITTFSNFWMLSNDPTPFDLGVDDRRIVVMNNNPPKLDKDGKFKLLADFAHWEKNRQISEERYNDLAAELNEYFMKREIVANLEHGSAPMTDAKMEMVEGHYTPPVMALKQLREMRGLGVISDVASEDKLIYVIRNVLGYPDFGKDKGKYDIWTPFLAARVIERVYQKDGKRSRVLSGCPSLYEREDYPLAAPVQASKTPQKLYQFTDRAEADWSIHPDGRLREEVFRDLEGLKHGEKGKSDVLNLVQSSNS